jgi:hypothetical protein
MLQVEVGYLLDGLPSTVGTVNSTIPFSRTKLSQSWLRGCASLIPAGVSES